MWIFVPPPTRESEKEKEKWKKNYVLFANYQMRLKSESRLYVNPSHVPDSMFDVARTDLPSLSLSLSLSRGPSRFFSIEEVEDAKGNSVCLSALGLSLSFFLDTHGRA